MKVLFYVKGQGWSVPFFWLLLVGFWCLATLVDKVSKTFLFLERFDIQFAIIFGSSFLDCLLMLLLGFIYGLYTFGLRDFSLIFLNFSCMKLLLIFFDLSF